MHMASFLTAQAARCRRLARDSNNDRTAEVLLRLADEYDDEARRAAIEEARVRPVGVLDRQR
jgi:hypothetical protein